MRTHIQNTLPQAQPVGATIMMIIIIIIIIIRGLLTFSQNGSSM